MARFEIPDVRGETRDSAVPSSDVAFAAAAMAAAQAAQATATSAQAAAAALAAAMPVASSTVPAGIADSAAQGSNPAVFDAAGHIHPSKARKARISVAAASYTWTYPTPFGTGVVPVVNGIAETVAGVTDLVNVQIDGPPTNTQATFKITRYTQGVVALVVGVLAINTTPLSIKLHLTAFEP